MGDSLEQGNVKTAAAKQPNAYERFHLALDNWWAWAFSFVVCVLFPVAVFFYVSFVEESAWMFLLFIVISMFLIWLYCTDPAFYLEKIGVVLFLAIATLLVLGSLKSSHFIPSDADVNKANAIGHSINHIVSSRAPQPALQRLPLLDRDEVIKVQAFMNGTSPVYMIIVGPKGCGKTTTSLIAAQNVPGVLYFEVREGDTLETLDKKILDTIGGGLPLTDLLARASTDSRLRRQPVIILDIASGAKFSSIIVWAKSMMYCARIILVSSDAYVATTPDIPDRQQLLWVGALSSDDVEAFFDRSRVLINHDDHGKRQRIMESTTNFQSLVKFITVYQGSDVDAYLKEVQERADREVSALFTSKDKDVPKRAGTQWQIVARLLLAEYTDGVSKKVVEGSVLPEPSIACVALKGDQQAIIYNMIQRFYRFATPAHKKAAKEWFLETYGWKSIKSVDMTKLKPKEPEL